MSLYTEWFQGRGTDDERMERCYWRRIGFGIFLVIAAGLLLIPMTGCNATTGPISGVCAVMPIGQNEQGVTFVRYQCQPQ